MRQDVRGSAFLVFVLAMTLPQSLRRHIYSVSRVKNLVYGIDIAGVVKKCYNDHSSTNIGVFASALFLSDTL